MGAIGLLFLSGLLLSPGAAVKAQSEPFYDDKTIRIVVGLSTGGGYDRVARAIAKHMPKHIPGNPKIIVQNMPGAGTVVAANFVYGVAKADGLTLLAPHNSLYLSLRRIAKPLECASVVSGRIDIERDKYAR